MELVELADVDLTYVTLESLDYDAGGQLYGTMEGSLTGERLSGTLRLTNLASRRTDNVNLPTLRGLLDTADGAQVWVELDGVATLRAEDQARVFVTTFRFRTATSGTRGSTRPSGCSKACSIPSGSAGVPTGASTHADRH